MAGEDMLFERREARGEAFEKEPKLLTAFMLALPAVVRNDRSIDLHADRQITRHHIGGEPVGIRAIGNRGPGDEHA